MPNKEEADEALKGLDKYHIRGYNINVEVNNIIYSLRII